MKGDKVIVRADREEALIRLVWAVDEDAVYITDEAGFGKLSAGLDGLFPIGFPREDVFRYDTKLAGQIGQPGWKWSSLVRYASGQGQSA